MRKQAKIEGDDMSKEAFYFKHDYHARNDPKLEELQRKYGIAAIGVYWGIVEMLYEEGGYLPFLGDSVAYSLRADTKLVANVIQSNLFENDTKRFWSTSALERLSERRESVEQGKAGATKRWKPPTEEEMAQYITETSKEFPGVNVVEEKIKFDLWWATKPLKNPKLAWRNWITKADAFNKGKPAPVELKDW